jgi:ABC-2 type transport system permease protein
MTGPGSLIWLLCHDARLAARRLGDLMPGLAPPRRRAVILALIVGGHALAWPVARWVAAAESDPERGGLLVAILVAVLGFALSWMLAQSLLGVTRTLYQRGDLDLMLSAPMPAPRIVAARTLGLAVENFASGAIFILPIAHALVLQGHAHWLGLYPLLAAMALASAALGLAAALGLFRLIGARRARAVAQAIAMVIGGVVALGIQAIAILPRDLRAALLGGLDLDRLSIDALAGHPAWAPVAAARGELGVLAFALAVAVALFLAATAGLGRAYMKSALISAGADLVPRAARRRAVTRFVADPAVSLRLKELRLLARDPWIMGQLALQAVYTLPVALILWRSGIGAAIPAVAVTPSLVIITAQMSGSLAWIAISGEDAPEFMATAPVSRGFVEKRKLEMIAAIVGAALAVPLALLFWHAPLAGLIALAFCAGAGISCALINLWHPTDGRRRAFMRRHAQSKLIGLIEHAMLLLWAIAAAVAQIVLVLGLLPAAAALGMLWMARRMLVAKGVRPCGSDATLGGVVAERGV